MYLQQQIFFACGRIMVSGQNRHHDCECSKLHSTADSEFAQNISSTNIELQEKQSGSRLIIRHCTQASYSKREEPNKRVKP